MSVDDIKLPPFKRMFVENWMPEDFAEESRRIKVTNEVYALRRKALTDRGWVFRRMYDGSEGMIGDKLVAYDPVTGLEVELYEAFTIQEECEPGSIPPWPKFDNNWNPPPSTEHRFNIVDIERKPMRIPSSDLSSREQTRMLEDQAVFDALDAVGKTDCKDD
jgi:hypothetical protein